MDKVEMGAEIKAFADAVQASIQQALMNWLRTYDTSADSPGVLVA